MAEFFSGTFYFVLFFNYIGLVMSKILSLIKGFVSHIAKNNDGRKPDADDSSETLIASGLADDAHRVIEELAEELGPRPAATKESRRAARHIASVFEKYSDDVTITSARMYPGLSRGFLIILIACLLLMFLFSSFRLPVLSVVLSGLYAWGISKEIRKEKSFLRRFLSSSEGANVHAVIEPEDAVLRTVIFSAHHDSAEIIEKRKGVDIHSLLSLYLPLASILIMGLSALIEIFSMLMGHSLAPGLASPAFIAISLFSLALASVSVFMYFRVGSEYSPGAGDNLSGLSAVIELLRYFSSKKSRGRGLKNTRLVFASFDGEECGAQGSAAWFRDNSYLLISPRMLNFDGLYKASDLAFLTQDGNGLVALDSQLAAKCSSLAAMMGHHVPTGKLGMLGGETDAVSAARAGIPATTLTSMKPEIRTPAHSADDTPDKVEPEALKVAISVGAKLAEDEDSFEIRAEEEHVPFLEDGKKYRLTK